MRAILTLYYVPLCVSALRIAKHDADFVVSPEGERILDAKVLVIFTGRGPCPRAVASIASTFRPFRNIQYFALIPSEIANLTRLLPGIQIAIQEQVVEHEEHVPYALSVQLFQWNKAVKLIPKFHQYDVVVRTRLDVIQGPATIQYMFDWYQKHRNDIGAFCKCHRKDLVHRGRLPIQDVFYVGNAENMFDVMTLYEQQRLQKHSKELSQCFMYSCMSDYYECSAIMRAKALFYAFKQVSVEDFTIERCNN